MTSSSWLIPQGLHSFKTTYIAAVDTNLSSIRLKVIYNFLELIYKHVAWNKDLIWYWFYLSLYWAVLLKSLSSFWRSSLPRIWWMRLEHHHLQQLPVIFHSLGVDFWGITPYIYFEIWKRVYGNRPPSLLTGASSNSPYFETQERPPVAYPTAASCLWTHCTPCPLIFCLGLHWPTSMKPHGSTEPYRKTIVDFLTYYWPEICYGGKSFIYRRKSWQT